MNATRVEPTNSFRSAQRASGDYCSDAGIPCMSEQEFAQLASLVRVHLGIEMPPSKKTMVASRLLKRLHKRELATFSDYCALLRTVEGFQSEFSHFVELITTHKTAFFREQDHFEVLTSDVLPWALSLDHRERPPSFWSAAASTGEEVYSMAMALASANSTVTPFLLGTDISDISLEKAARATYTEEAVQGIPLDQRRRFLLQSKDSSHGLVRIRPELRAWCTFRRLNLMEESWPGLGTFDAIFCRNVLIYFSPKDQETIVRHLHRHLRPGGFLFLGHAETMPISLTQFQFYGRATYRSDPNTRGGAR